MTGSEVITLRDGTVVSLAVLKCLWAIEARGGRLNRTDDGGFQVTPQGIVTPNERVFLLENQDEARRLVRYQADDSHLTDAAALSSPVFASG
jgi:hypothetical protein